MTRISSSLLYASATARRSATFSGVYPPQLGSFMLKYRYTRSGSTLRMRRTPRLSSHGAMRPPGMAMLMNSLGTFTQSSSRLRNASQRGCASSRIETSTRSTIGRRLPFTWA